MLKSPISVLQELAQTHKISLGQYTVVNSSGQDHCKSFTYQVIVNDKPYLGTGTTKQSAKTNCAKTALDAISENSSSAINLKIEMHSLLPNATAPVNKVAQINYVGQLNEYQQSNKYPIAIYDDQIPIGLEFCTKCCFAGLESTGFGLTKKDAKQNAALEMIKLVREKKLGMAQNLGISLEERYASNNNNISEEYIIEKYKALSVTIRDESKNRSDDDHHQYRSMDSSAIIETWEDLKGVLEDLRYTYTAPATLQRDPWVVYMTINEGTMMGMGETKTEAMSDMIQNIGKVLKDGYKFNVRKCL